MSGNENTEADLTPEQAAGGAAANPGKRRLRYAGWALVALVFCLMPCGFINHGDGGARYAQAKAILFHHSMAVPPEYAYGRDGKLIFGILPAPNGKLYSKYGIGTSLLWLPPTALGWALSRVTHANLDMLAGFFISFVNPIMVVLLAISIYWILREFGVGARARWITLVLYLFGTSALPYANTAFSEPFIALLLLWALVLPVLRPGWKSAVIAGVLLTCCTLTKPEFAPLPACIAAAVCREAGAPLATCVLRGGGGGRVVSGPGQPDIPRLGDALQLRLGNDTVSGALGGPAALFFRDQPEPDSV